MSMRKKQEAIERLQKYGSFYVVPIEPIVSLGKCVDCSL